MHGATRSPLSLSSCLLALLAAACGADRAGDKAGAAAPATAPPPATAAADPGAATPAPAASASPDSRRRSPQHPVYSLVDNRLSAHVLRGGGLFVPAGSAGAGKYLRYFKDEIPLELRRERDGRRVARPTDSEVTLHVPVAAGQLADGARLWLRGYSERPLDVELRVNGEKLDAVAIRDGWSTAEIALPDGALRAGENRIELAAGKRNGSLPELAWLQIGGAAPGDDPEPGYDAAAGALVLPDGGGAAYYVAVPDQAHLIGDVAGDGCAVAVRATPTEGAPVTGELRGTDGFVDLSALAGKAVRLELVAGGCQAARVTGAALAVPGEPPTVTRGDPPRYLILWVMDALRAGSVRSFNPDARAEVPEFEKLTGTAAVFVHNYVQGNESRASYGSIWTSLYPVVHGWLSSRGGIANKWLTIDELMKSAGMYASGVTANGYITIKRGFGTEWDQYLNLIHEKGGLKGDWILDKALTTIEKRKDEPWFLYIGTIDTHATWRAKEPWLSKYDEGPYKGPFTKSVPAVDMAKVNAGTMKLTHRDILRIRAMYDANVSYADQLVGELFARLDEWGIRDQTMIIITADHGDELLERAGVVGHAKSLRETLVHVPLIIYYPPLFPAGKVVEGTEVVDIVPTIADAFGVEWNDQWQGESLLPLAHGVGAGYPRMSFASQFEHTHAGRIGRWKLVAKGNRKGNRKGEIDERLYDVETDPGERTDLAADRPIERRLVADALWLLRTHNRAWHKRAWGNAANTRAGFPADMGE